MLGLDQLLCHLIGDYILQNDWQATNKKSSKVVAAIHGAIYVTPFLFITQSVRALAVMAVTHSVIDHYGLAKYVKMASNMLAPKRHRPSWASMKETGFPPGAPPFIAIWVIIIIDNIMHILINRMAVAFL